MEGGHSIGPGRSWEQCTRLRKRNAREEIGIGYDVTHTPGGEFAKIIKAEENENYEGQTNRIKIIEKGGVTLAKKLRRSNLRAGGKCGRDRCFLYRSPTEGNCWREGVRCHMSCVKYHL